MTKSQPGLYELLRQRSLKRRIGESEGEGAVSSATAEVATIERRSMMTAEAPRPEPAPFEVSAPEQPEDTLAEEPAAFEPAPGRSENAPSLWRRGLWLSAPILAAVSLLGAVMVFAGYQLGYSRGAASASPDLWAGSGGAPQAQEVAKGSFVGVLAGSFEDLRTARQLANQLNRSGQFPMPAEVYESADGSGQVDLVLGNFASESEAAGSGILDRLREWRVGEGTSAQKPFDKAELKHYAVAN
ncbi:MAG: hypothetical protein RL885_27765 [Planctomycetota bacterium]